MFFSLSHKVSHFHVQRRPVPSGATELCIVPSKATADHTELIFTCGKENQNKIVTII